MDDLEKKKIALIGLSNCDIWALFAFLKEFEDTNLLHKREDLLIVGAECLPDQNCFCEKMGTDKYAPFDIFLQEEKNDYSVFTGTKHGEKILKKIGILKNQKLILRPIKNKKDNFNLEQISKTIKDRTSNEDFWQGISDNCFGCGACTAVCPLCFCTRQDFINNIKGESSQCLKWDSCFAKRFSEVQNNFDLRPQNIDRLYNWYHHKFVRAKHENNHYLCTGCGRCIEACPANLNIKNILENLANKDN